MKHPRRSVARALWIVATIAALAACGGASSATGSGRCHNGVCQGDPPGATSGGSGASDAGAATGDASAVGVAVGP